MLSAEWLFQNHWDHITMVKLLEIQLDTEANSVPMTEEERDEEIATMVLYRPALDGLPRMSGNHVSPTEKVVFALEQNDTAQNTSTLQKKLTIYRFLLKTFDSLMFILESSEQEFIDYYYGKHMSLARITEIDNSPVFGLSKTTAWAYKLKLIRKCDFLLHRLYPSILNKK